MRIKRAIYLKFVLRGSCKRLKVLCQRSKTRGKVMTGRLFSLSEIMSFVFWNIFTSIVSMAGERAQAAHRHRDYTGMEE